MPFRNKTIPIIDLEKRFEVKETENKDKILIVNINNKTYGFLVSKIFNISSPNPIKCDLTFINQKEEIIKDVLVNTENDLIFLLNKENII
jgi:chemotaxis signal transduction protein